MAYPKTKKRRPFLVSSVDFVDGKVMTARQFSVVAAIAVFGNYLCGFGLYATFGVEALDSFLSVSLLEARLADYDQIGPVSAFSYLGSFFSLFFLPIVTFITGKSRLVRRTREINGRRVARATFYSAVAVAVALLFYFGSLAEFGRLYLLLLFPIFPFLSAIVSLFLAFPAMQLLVCFEGRNELIGSS